jgi:hypothetical protein
LLLTDSKRYDAPLDSTPLLKSLLNGSLYGLEK